ncbi:hypothetical protein GCM10010954_27250 [Halobacillus andaensis]|uniref:HEAT repeat domain-containing protein n=1 Tax=Halobacillus andaensis TaxID=1176239 RepID=A0A917B859_HALAA|nr:hypothetical protein [Halobacillus andaensis]MBP2005689.1 hypothetical protein [Halobacillus andaensis]GGF26751.1 hypothetical protein GCM10010954_27250 [Halobacillus andaensis]
MVEIVIWVSALLLLTQLGLLGYLLLSKARRLKMERTIQHHYSKVLPEFLAYFHGQKEEAPAMSIPLTKKRKIIERVLDKAVDQADMELDMDRIQRTAHQHLSVTYHRHLKKGSWSQRVNALYYIEDFAMLDLKTEVWNHLNRLEQNDEEYRQALRVLAAFNDERMIPYILEQRDLSIGLVKQLLRRMHFDLHEQLIDIMTENEERVPYPLQMALITYCGEVGDRNLIPFVESLLTHVNSEVRLKAMRSLTEYRYISDPVLLFNFFHSPYWEERMYAARLTGILTLSQYKEELITLAGDEQWWVRYAACHAVKRLPDGEKLLNFTSREHKDLYARDMAKRTLTLKAGG